MERKYSAESFLVAVFAVLVILADRVHAQAPFYQGKTITVIQGRDPGGIGDLRVKAVLPYLSKHIPGNPTIVMQFMPGGAGRKAANHIYTAARPDGLTLGALSGGIVAMNILGETGIMYDIDRFIYLGTPESTTHYVIYTRKELGLGRLERLRGTPGIRIGAQSVGHVTYVAGRLFVYLLGLKEPKFITGYAGPEVDIALVRGELDARANNATSVLRRNPDWVEKGLMDFHAILEVPKGVKHPRFAHLPEIESFVKSENETKLLSMWRTFSLVGSPYILPPGTPKEQVEILQEAMRTAFKDPEFHSEYKKFVGDEADPLMPEAVTKAIREIPRDAEVIDLLKKLSGAGPLPAR